MKFEKLKEVKEIFASGLFTFDSRTMVDVNIMDGDQEYVRYASIEQFLADNKFDNYYLFFDSENVDIFGLRINIWISKNRQRGE